MVVLFDNKSDSVNDYSVKELDSSGENETGARKRGGPEMKEVKASTPNGSTATESGEGTKSSSIDFGTAEAMDHIRTLTVVGAMTRLLHECIAYQRSLDLVESRKRVKKMKLKQCVDDFEEMKKKRSGSWESLEVEPWR
ncbi:hypothetical protein SO802_006584 [Lithocarpus litseifolius]|uniref:Uncharacterized protein n=1 Tax=Lithocarpus litseifolius TaxID=425828 RepID=A0AAW2DR29_9ROSI